MDYELITRVFIPISFVIVIAMRVYFYKKTGIAKEGIRENRENPVFLAALFLLILSLFVSLFVYVVYPQLIQWASLPFPMWLRFCGIAAGIAGFFLLRWVHVALGRYFSGSLYVRDDHQLIEDGPYKYVRHPMYSTLLLMHTANFVMCANWLIGVIGFAMIGLIMMVRVPVEESMLVGKFGDKYREYMQSTKRFVPILW